MRVGFLFNDYSHHHVPHAAPYAYELSRRHPESEVITATSSEAESDMTSRWREVKTPLMHYLTISFGVW